MSDNEKITVLYTGKVPLYPAGLTFHPGANLVDKKAWDAFAQCDYAKAKMRGGVLRPQLTPKATEEFDPEMPPVSLGALKPKAALAAIAACNNVEQLEQWLATDGRPSTREAIIKRRYAIAEKTGEAPETPDTGYSVETGMGGGGVGADVKWTNPAKKE
jgi:hypothetical protein